MKAKKEIIFWVWLIFVFTLVVAPFIHEIVHWLAGVIQGYKCGLPNFLGLMATSIPNCPADNIVILIAPKIAALIIILFGIILYGRQQKQERCRRLFLSIAIAFFLYEIVFEIIIFLLYQSQWYKNSDLGNIMRMIKN